MNSNLPSPRPDGPADDPLLAALRRQLADYGQAPAPAAWAGIRQRLPVARPWWRRPRRLLSVFSLLLLVGGAGGLLTRPPQADAPAATRAEELTNPSTPATALSAGQLAQPGTKGAAANTAAAPAASEAAGALPVPERAAVFSTAPGTGPAATRPAHHGKAVAEVTAKALAGSAASATPANACKPFHYQSVASRVGFARALAGRRRAVLGGAAQRQPPALPVGAASVPHWPIDNPVHPIAPAADLAAASGTATRQLPGSTSAAVLEALAPESTPTAAATTVTPSWPAGSQADGEPAAAPTASIADARSLSTITALRSPPSFSFGQATAPTTADNLPTQMPGRLVALNLLALPPLLALAQRVAEAPQLSYPLARRWALQAVAGPTVSYRQLGAAPAEARGGRTAPLERPTLALGAQAQLRRALTSRWALAAGLGYHEYAAQLHLLLRPAAASAARPVQHREHYRLLTLPVQASYALGLPHGRWTAALLAGAEAGLLLQVRSTEGSDCSCQQHGFTVDNPAAGNGVVALTTSTPRPPAAPIVTAEHSPYRPLSLALTLGLDLRYRLGTSRWQWLVQPTGRYVLTSVVRPDAVGFATRQPYSLGLFTGFAWDVR